MINIQDTHVLKRISIHSVISVPSVAKKKQFERGNKIK